MRCAFWVGKKMLVHVDKHTIDNKPALWSFGGTVAGEDEDRADLRRKFGAKWFEGELGIDPDDDPNDISCLVPTESEDDFRKWLDDKQSTLPIATTAKKEIREEFKELSLPLHLADAVRCGKFERYDEGGLIYTYAGKESPNAMCYMYVVQCGAPRAVEREIEDLVERYERLYLITRADVERGHIQGIVKDKPGEILVPEGLELLFR